MAKLGWTAAAHPAQNRGSVGLADELWPAPHAALPANRVWRWGEATSSLEGIFINPVKAPARKQELGRLVVQFSVDVAAFQLPIQGDSVWRWLVEGKFGLPPRITVTESEFDPSLGTNEIFE